MQTIYQPQGRAAEYAHLAVNLMTGCPFRCAYCFCPGALHVTRERFHAQGGPRPGIIEALAKAAPKYAGTKKRVLLSFIGDVYCPEAVASGVTRRALQILREHDIPFTVLTKNGPGATMDFYLYRPGVDELAVTLTCDSYEMELRWEPHAPPWHERILALREAHERGIGTWASIEPVLDSLSSLRLIALAAPVCDLFKLGKLNHARSDIDWRSYGQQAIELCRQAGKAYYVKADLAAYLGGVEYSNTDNRSIGRHVTSDK